MLIDVRNKSTAEQQVENGRRLTKCLLKTFAYGRNGIRVAIAQFNSFTTELNLGLDE